MRREQYETMKRFFIVKHKKGDAMSMGITDPLELLQQENKRLQSVVDEQDKEIARLTKILEVMERIGKMEVIDLADKAGLLDADSLNELRKE